MSGEHPKGQGTLPGHRPRQPPGSPRISLLVHGLLLIGATSAVFLAGGPPQGSLGIFLACAGVALMLCPPQVKVDGRLWLAAGGLVACGSLAFLPSAWLGVPSWRTTLASAGGIVLPGSVSLVPWETGFWLALLGLSLLTGLLLLSHPIRSMGLLAFATGAATVCGTYAALAIYAKETGWHYAFDGGATFGFFPNRNHTATFLVVGSVLSMGVLGVVLRERRWTPGIVASAALSLCVAGLFFFSTSRGGIVFLLGGTLLWIAGLGMTHRNTPLLVSCAVLMVAGGALFWFSGSVVRNRLVAEKKNSVKLEIARQATLDRVQLETASGHPEDVPFDFRILVYRDTLRMIRDFPVTGVGLGAFAPDFAQYRNASLSESALIHPESDWLMLTAEMGVGALICFLGLIWLLARRLAGLSSHPYWPLRWGCVAAAATATLHGLVDVPMHRVALGWWVLVVAGLGFQIGAGKGGTRSRVQHMLFVAGGVVALALGIQLIRAEWFGGRPLPPFVAKGAQQEILATFDRGNLEGAVEMARLAVKASPMSLPLYYQLGVLLLRGEDTDAEVDQVFRAQRLLNPTWPMIPLRQGDAWLAVDAQRTGDLWLDALARQEKMDRGSVERRPTGSINLYADLVRRAAPYPELQRRLLPAAGKRPAFVLAWLEGAAPGVASGEIGAFQSDDGFLGSCNEDQRGRFLLAWYHTGDRAMLARFIQDHPEWQEAAWPIQVRQLVDSRDFEQAVRQTARRYGISLSLPDAAGNNPPAPGQAEEGADPASAFAAYWRAGNTVAARRVLEDASDPTKGTASPEVWRLKAALSAQNADWAAAWDSLKRSVGTGRGAALP